MEEKMKISEAELEVLQVLWEAEEPLKIQDVCDRLENKKWKYNTVGTLLLRMAEKAPLYRKRKTVSFTIAQFGSGKLIRRNRRKHSLTDCITALLKNWQCPCSKGGT